MKPLKKKDQQYRLRFLAFEQARVVRKVLFCQLLSRKGNSRGLLLYRLLYPRNKRYKYYTKMVRRCVATGRGRGVQQAFGLSRTLLRELLGFGRVPGYRKAVW
jgi:ribosomal protein S14